MKKKKSPPARHAPRHSGGRSSPGIVLSGTGTDGTLGLRAIKGAGGLALAQLPESAKFPGRPESAVATGIVATMRESLLVLDGEFTILSANPAFGRTFQLSPADIEGEKLFVISEVLWDVPELRQALEKLTRGSAFSW